MGYEFEEQPTGRRTLVLGRIDADFPLGKRFKILKVEGRESASGTYGAILTEGEEGEEYEFLAWTRDVKNLVRAWGKSTDGWIGRWVTAQKKEFSTRAYLVPTENPVEVETIGMQNKS